MLEATQFPGRELREYITAIFRCTIWHSKYQLPSNEESILIRITMGNTIFITGTGTGFGKIMVKCLASNGFTIIAGMPEISQNNKAISDELSLISGVEVVEIDVEDDKSVTDAFDYTIKKYETIDVLINNSAANGNGVLESHSHDQIRQAFEINFFGILRTYQAVLSVMRRAKKVLIINITSGETGHALPYMVPYLSSKMAVESLSEGLREELKLFKMEGMMFHRKEYFDEVVEGEKEGINPGKKNIIIAIEERAVKGFHAIRAAFMHTHNK